MIFGNNHKALYIKWHIQCPTKITHGRVTTNFFECGTEVSPQNHTFFVSIGRLSVMFYRHSPVARWLKKDMPIVETTEHPRPVVAHAERAKFPKLTLV